MNITEIAKQMWPCWALGAIILHQVWNSKNKDLLRIQPDSLKKWIGFLFLITALRVMAFDIYILLKGSAPPLHKLASTISQIPILATFTTFWEDACHGLPLVLLRRWMVGKWFSKPLNILATLAIMLSFGSGHTYQGIIPALMLTMYIPISAKLGEKHGFGTVMIGHSLYDFFTLLTVKWMLLGGL